MRYRYRLIALTVFAATAMAVSRATRRQNSNGIQGLETAHDSLGRSGSAGRVAQHQHDPDSHGARPQAGNAGRS